MNLIKMDLLKLNQIQEKIIFLIKILVLKLLMINLMNMIIYIKEEEKEKEMKCFIIFKLLIKKKKCMNN